MSDGSDDWGSDAVGSGSPFGLVGREAASDALSDALSDAPNEVSEELVVEGSEVEVSVSPFSRVEPNPYGVGDESVGEGEGFEDAPSAVLEEEIVEVQEVRVSPFGVPIMVGEISLPLGSEVLVEAIKAEEDLLLSGFARLAEEVSSSGVPEELDEWVDAPVVFSVPGRSPFAVSGAGDDSRRLEESPEAGTRGEGEFIPPLSREGEVVFYPAGQLPKTNPWVSEVHSEGFPEGAKVPDFQPRSPFESLFEVKPSVVEEPEKKRGRPAGGKNKVLSSRAVAQVKKVKATEIRGSNLSPEVLAKAKRTARKNAEVDDHTIDGIRLTPRDYMMLAFLARYRVATVGQLARAFNTSQTALRNRLPRLQRAGLLDWAWGASTKPKLWFITEAGLDTVGMDLSSPTIKWGQLRHTLGLVDLGIDFEKEREVVLTEREIRAAATRHLPTSRMKSAIGPDLIDENLSYDERANIVQGFIRESLILPIPGRAFGHIPDMVLVRQPYPNGASGNISIELELTRKSISEWKTILTGYRDSNVFAEVYYFVLNPDLKRSLNKVIKSIRAQDKIKVLDFKPVDLTADPYTSGGGTVIEEE